MSKVPALTLNRKGVSGHIEIPVIRASGSRSITDVVNEDRSVLQHILGQHGVIVFRAFDLDIPNFCEFVRLFSEKEPFSYAGGVSPRLSLGSGLYTSTEYPPEIELILHNELSYSTVYPRHIYFFCAIAPAVGGQTTIGRSRSILKQIDPEVVEHFKKLGVLYERRLNNELGSGYSWQDAFETDNKQTVERLCRTLGADVEWLPDNILKVSQKGPGTAVHPETGEEVWFNQAAGFHASVGARRVDVDFAPRLSSKFGDGSEIPDEMIQHIREIVKDQTQDHAWERSDVLVLDNIQIAHGRRPFAGERKIAVTMT